MTPIKTPNILVINGSPRKHGNTATLLDHAMKGAESSGAKTELVHLYDLDYKGCRSCFACKLPGKPTLRCAIKDDLAPVLEKARRADAILIGTPVYYGAATGETRSFLERLLFPLSSWDDWSSLLGKEISVGLIVTMGANERQIEEFGYRPHFARMEHHIRHILGSCEPLYVTDTRHVADYGQYRMKYFNAEAKQKRHEEVFPEDCKKAYAMGARMVRNKS